MLFNFVVNIIILWIAKYFSIFNFKVLYYIFTIILLETEALPKAKTNISQNDQHLERNKRSPDSCKTKCLYERLSI